MSSVNYKEKYNQLKQRFQESVDVAFRLGYEQGAQAQQQQQMQDQQQQIADQQAAQAQAAAGGMGGQPGDPTQGGQPGQDPSQGGAPGAQMSEDSRGVGQQAQGAGAGGMAGAAGPSELDSHIGELEGLMAKSDYGSEQWETLHKSINNLKSIKVAMDLSKNNELIKSIGRNLSRPLVIGGRAKHNMPEHSKTALTLQHKIVGEIMEKWESEEKGIPTEIGAILRSEGLSKKE